MKSFANKPIGSSKVISFIFTILLSDSGIGKTFESFKNVYKHRRCGRFSFKEVCKTYSFAVYIGTHHTHIHQTSSHPHFHHRIWNKMNTITKFVNSPFQTGIKYIRIIPSY